MIGINVDKFDNIISKLTDLSSTANTHFKKIRESLADVNCSYEGQTLNNIFSFSLNNNINPERIMNKYIEILNSVKKSYVKQDEIFSGQIDYLKNKIAESINENKVS